VGAPVNLKIEGITHPLKMPALRPGQVKQLVHRFRKSFTFQPFGSRSSSIGSERVGHSSRRCL
jgi:twitching motility protein PilU